MHDDDPEKLIFTTSISDDAPPVRLVDTTMRSWRAVWLHPSWIWGPGHPTLKERLKRAYGWDIFFGNIPVLKVFFILNALTTYLIVRFG